MELIFVMAAKRYMVFPVLYVPCANVMCTISGSITQQNWRGVLGLQELRDNRSYGVTQVTGLGKL